MNISVKLRIILEICISCFLLVCYFLFCIFQGDMIEQTLSLALDQTLFPRAITITVIIMCCLLFYDSIRLYINHKKGIITPEIHEFYECSEETIPVGRILAYLGILFGYLIALYYIGFMYSTPVVTLCIAGLLGIKRIFLAAISSVLFTVFLYYASFYGLQIILPGGILFEKERYQMIEDILVGLVSILNPASVLAIAFGLIVGLLFGSIPGISGIMAISILLPLTFYVSPLVGIPMLLGIYKAGIYGGSITAVLLNTPGAPPAICTAMSGFPMAQRGQAGKALNAALVGSVYGDAFSNLLLILVAAPISYVAIKIGPTEQFCLILLALTVVGSISGNSILKGMICAGFGILLSMVGVSGVSGAIRFTFDSEYLLSGIQLIPMVIGLLCLPEIIHQVGTCARNYITEKIDLKSENGRLTWKEFKQNFYLLFRSSVIGSIIGAMPRLGASPAAFMAYSDAQRRTKDQDAFAKGNVEGILAPESANNATTGSAMIPLLTLGIPGDDVTAVLMGAFLIQGITPGPNIFFEHTQVVYGIFGSLIICDILLYFIAKLGFKVWIKILDLPRSLIFSSVTIFAFLGTYSINQSLFDIFCLICFGIMGYLMRLFHFSAGAMIIGFILGPILEKAYDQSMSLSNGSYMIFLESPVAVILLAMTVVSMISIYRMRVRKFKKLMEKNIILEQ